MKDLLLGLNLSHDSSAALTDISGNVIYAVAEERLTRVKGHFGIPRMAIARILQYSKPMGSIQRVYIGSHRFLRQEWAERMIDAARPGHSGFGRVQVLPPGQYRARRGGPNPHERIEKYLREQFSELEHVEFEWIHHHDAHLGAALPFCGWDSQTLVLSLDGEGDNSSGAVALVNRGRTSVLKRFSRGASLGLMYSAVTERYGFVSGRHEGKILGLSGSGQHSGAYRLLHRAIQIRAGVPVDRSFPFGAFGRRAQALFSRMGLLPIGLLDWPAVINRVEKETNSFPDLAFAAQRVLEDKVVAIVDYWTRKSGARSLVLTGGVFANVLLNQKLANLSTVDELAVVPDMGDSGLALGAIFSALSGGTQSVQIPKNETQCVAPPFSSEDNDTLSIVTTSPSFRVTQGSRAEIATLVAKHVSQGQMVGIHQGAMESGPRALGNRTIVIDPRDAKAPSRANSRLRRTEFMPLAPVLLEQEFTRFFQLEDCAIDYRYMTVTCSVLPNQRNLIPAVVHVDGTARPQVLGAGENPFLEDVLRSFRQISGLGMLVNTSLNVHEEPINGALKDSVRMLLLGGIDFLAINETYLVEMSPNHKLGQILGRGISF